MIGPASDAAVTTLKPWSSTAVIWRRLELMPGSASVQMRCGLQNALVIVVLSSALNVANYNALFIVMFAISLFNSSMGGHVPGSICLAISGARAVVIKIQLDLIWGTMATRGGKYVYKRVCTARRWMSLWKPCGYR